VVATLAFYRGKAKISESEPIRVTQAPKARPHIAPFQFPGPAGEADTGPLHLPGQCGRRTGRKFAFARQPVVVDAIDGSFHIHRNQKKGDRQKASHLLLFRN
jgi:hypothetical protein